jgi:hypothetical protein
MSEPKRIQRKRSRGWKMPANTLYIGRPTAWGNPFKVGVWGTAQECIEAYERWIDPTINAELTAFRNSLYDDPKFDHSFSPYWGVCQVWAGYLNELRGHDLACWCREGEPCHGDVLLRMANQGESC